jgi:hypothetical protein
MSLPGLNSSFSNADLNAMQSTAANGLNAPSNGVQQYRTSAGQVFLENVEIIEQETPSPFTVSLTKEEGADAVLVTVGTVNNVIPLINGTIMTNPAYTPILLPTSDGDYLIVIKCKADPPPASFPRLDSEIKVETYPATDTDDYGFIALANVNIMTVSGNKNITVNQLVSGSLWAERHKYTQPDTAWYYFYRV